MQRVQVLEEAIRQACAKVFKEDQVELDSKEVGLAAAGVAVAMNGVSCRYGCKCTVVAQPMSVDVVQITLMVYKQPDCPEDVGYAYYYLPTSSFIRPETAFSMLQR